MKKSLLVIAMGIFGTAAFAQDAAPVQSKKLKNQLKHVVIDSDIKSNNTASEVKVQTSPANSVETKPTKLKTKLIKKEAQK